MLCAAPADQVFRELRNAARLFASRKADEVVDGAAREVPGADLADRVEPFHRKTDRIETTMAPGTGRIVRVQSQ